MTTDLSMWAAFAAGLISFASPCVLPLMPGYISYLSGVSAEEARTLDRRVYLTHILTHCLVFGAGFTAVFVTMGLTATSIGNFISGNLIFFQRAAGVLLIFFGLQMTGVLRFSWLLRERRFNLRESKAGVLRSFFLGTAFAFGWTPCVGPVLGTVLTMAAAQEQATYGGALLLSYSLGLGIPFVLTGIALSWSLSFVSRAGRFLHFVHTGAGVIIIAMGVLLVTGAFSRLAFFFSSFSF